MSLDIGEAFGEGLSRLTTASGLSLAVASPMSSDIPNDDGPGD